MVTTILVFFILLSILVFVHEMGHFLAAKWSGILVEEFGFGLPPRIWGKKWGETILSINALPIGGFVRLYGEDPQGDEEYRRVMAPSGRDTAKDAGMESRSFQHKPKKIRAAILLAGVAMNFLLAVVLTGVLLVTGIQEPSGRVHVEQVVPGSPAEQAGLEQGDIIGYLERTPLEGSGTVSPVEITVPSELMDYVSQAKGVPVVIHVIRNGTPLVLTAVPRTEVPPGEGPLGVVISDLEIRKYSLLEAPGKALVINIERAWGMLASLGTAITNLVTTRKAPTDIAGPIGIAQVTGAAVRIGWQAVIEFASLLSLNLAVLNLLPIPALDGGRLLFVVLEKIMGRKVKPAFERSAHQWGMLVLLLLVLLISFNDIRRLTSGG